MTTPAPRDREPLPDIAVLGVFNRLVLGIAAAALLVAIRINKPA